MSQFPKLLSPVRIGALELKNRIAMAPMTRGRTDVQTGVPTDFVAKYYEQRASAGLIISEATSISKQGHGWSGAPGIYTAEQVAGWRKVTDAVHARGGAMFLQLWHMGRQTHSSFFGLHPISASPIATPGKAALNGGASAAFEVPKAADEADIKNVIAEYKHAAECAKEAGFDGVEVHGANGYLLDQFMQSCTNQRTDSYGGSLENRYRLVGEVMDSVLKVWPANRVAIRLAPNSIFGGMGSADNADMFTYAGRQLNALKLAYMHVIDGAAFGVHKKGPLMKLSDWRKVFDGALIGNCGYTPQTAEAAIDATNGADLIAIGRQYMSNPDLVERVANNQPLAAAPLPKLWYRQPGEDQSKGLIDFPTYQAK